MRILWHRICVRDTGRGSTDSLLTPGGSIPCMPVDTPYSPPTSLCSTLGRQLVLRSRVLRGLKPPEELPPVKEEEGNRETEALYRPGGTNGAGPANQYLPKGNLHLFHPTAVETPSTASHAHLSMSLCGTPRTPISPSPQSLGFGRRSAGF
jgi:hypothetical protein